MTRLISIVAISTTALAVAGCGSSTAPSTDTTTAATTTTAEAPCTFGAIKSAAAKTAQGGESRAVIEDPGSYHCADGWATAFYASSKPNGGDDGNGSIGTVVFKSDDGVWTAQDRATVCAKPSPVPDSIYENACNNPGESKDTGPDQAQ